MYVTIWGSGVFWGFLAFFKKLIFISYVENWEMVSSIHVIIYISLVLWGNRFGPISMPSPIGTNVCYTSYELKFCWA